jgi:hypothetical protein
MYLLLEDLAEISQTLIESFIMRLLRRRCPPSIWHCL